MFSITLILTGKLLKHTCLFIMASLFPPTVYKLKGSDEKLKRSLSKMLKNYFCMQLFCSSDSLSMPDVSFI